MVYVTAAAREEAERLLPGRVPENVVEEAIMAARVTGSSAGFVWSDSWRAHYVREPGHLRRRPRAWRVRKFEERGGRT